jgi:putative membrane protein insertion efficiency factor
MLSKILSQLLILPVKVYQYTLSPLLGSSKCRFQPTCSHYMVQAIEVHGPFKGLYLGIRRILKCHPWGPHGHDPVPKRNQE